MANLATKAPNFTPETARIYALKSAAVRKLNREAEAVRVKELEAIAAASEKPEPDEARKQKVLKQIDQYLEDMSGASHKNRLMIGKAVAELWKLVQPTAGVSKPSRSRPSSVFSGFDPLAAPQEPSRTRE